MEGRHFGSGNRTPAFQKDGCVAGEWVDFGGSETRRRRAALAGFLSEFRAIRRLVALYVGRAPDDLRSATRLIIVAGVPTRSLRRFRTGIQAEEISRRPRRRRLCNGTVGRYSRNTALPPPPASARPVRRGGLTLTPRPPPVSSRSGRTHRRGRSEICHDETSPVVSRRGLPCRVTPPAVNKRALPDSASTSLGLSARTCAATAAPSTRMVHREKSFRLAE
jgi:hypothetical protein